MGKLIEGLWDCKYCSRKGIPGSKRECTSCGNVRDKDTKFYLPKDVKHVPKEIAKNISKNPDWVCLYCGYSLNPDNAESCLSCGAQRTSKNKNYFEYQKKSEEQFTASQEQKAGETLENQSQDCYSTNQSDRIKKLFSENKKKILIILSVIVLIISLIVGLIYIIAPKEKNITINEICWNRSIEIEKSKTVNENDWILPSDGRLIYTNQEIYGYEQKIDHYETRTLQVAKERLIGYQEVVVGMKDLGNGYFEEITQQQPVYETYYEEEQYKEPVYVSIPVYKTKYYYEIERWFYERSIDTVGLGNNPYWGEVDLEEKEREKCRTEKYIIKGKDSKGKQYEINIPFNQWKELTLDETVKVKIFVTGNGEIIK